jgi:hypothetical protein
MPEEGKVFYSAFGLSFRSNREIPGLIPSKIPTAADVELFLGVRPANSQGHLAEELYYESSDTDENGQPGYRLWRTSGGDFLRMDYVDGVQFWFDRRAASIWCSWPESLAVADAAVYLLGPVMGLLLRLRGVTCLHASAVGFGGYAVAFVGPEGAGKSTTAAALGRRGHAIISDDIVAVEEREGGFVVFPAHPYLGLWPESVAMLFGSEKKLPEFAATWDKGRFSLNEHDLAFQERALPLRAICLLEQRTSDPSAPFLEEESSREGLIALVTNSYGGNLLDRDLRAREFEMLGRLVTQVPVQRVRASSDRSRMDALCDLIERSYFDS